MKKALFNLFSFLLTFAAYANDGIYLTHGGAIYPIKESKIKLDREILSFSVKDKICSVNILFEFNNPENIDRKLMIGFQAPTAVGDVSDNLANTNQITDFKIISNGQILPYSLKAAECEDCELNDPDKMNFTQSEQGIFVYLFEATFKPGINKINHSYTFPASMNVMYNQFYSYILTTGSKWAGGSIGHLTVNFDIGDNQYFYVNNIFGKQADWSIIGTGKVTDKYFENDITTGRMVRILSGILQIDVPDFSPPNNIEFGIICENSFITASTDSDKLESGEVYSLCNFLLDDNSYSRETLKILRNTVYAQHGYLFKDKNLKAYFSQFEWYIPDPNLTMEHIQLTEKEKALIEEILNRENE